MLFLFALERLDAGSARFEQGGHRAELRFRRLRLAVGCACRRPRLCACRRPRPRDPSPRAWHPFSPSQSASGWSAVRFRQLARAAASLSRAAIASALADSIFLSARGQVGELLLNRLRLFLLRLEFAAHRVQLRARVLQRDRQRFFFADDVGELRAQRVGNLSAPRPTGVSAFRPLRRRPLSRSF